jgi:hypothetical protein
VGKHWETAVDINGRPLLMVPIKNSRLSIIFNNSSEESKNAELNKFADFIFGPLQPGE